MQGNTNSKRGCCQEQSIGHSRTAAVCSLGKRVISGVSPGRDTAQWAVFAGIVALLIIVVIAGITLVRRVTRPRVVPEATATVAQSLATVTMPTAVLTTPTSTQEPTIAVATTVPPTEQVVQEATDTPEPTLTPEPSPTATPAAPTPIPTPSLEEQITAAVGEYTRVRAEAEEKLDPTLLAQVCVDPYLSWKTDNIKQNIATGGHWETRAVNFTVTSVKLLDADTADVWVNKTETKLWIPGGATAPDDETCLGAILSYRDCTYDAHYVMLRREGRWYVSVAEAPGANCQNKCQR